MDEDREWDVNDCERVLRNLENVRLGFEEGENI